MRLFLMLRLALVPLMLTLSLVAYAKDWRFTDVDRVVAVSDIHGAYDELVATLNVAGIIDNERTWNGGTSHLVITGDLLDRGPNSRRVMDLIMRLEREAPLAGGRVHQLLGNHEVMNLIGDLRYVSDEEYAAFLDVETSDEREYWYREFRRTKPIDSDEAKIRSDFEEHAPPGFFGHRREFRHDGYYGRWLLDKPIMVVINDTAYVHGGVPPYVAEHGLSGINIGLKEDLSDYVVARDSLADASTLSPIVNFRATPEFLNQLQKTNQMKGDSAAAARMILEQTESPLHGPVGPTWYRGTATCSALVEGDRLSAALEKLAASRVVIGHTPTSSRRVQQRMNGQIVEIDTGMLRANYQGSGHALIIDSKGMSVVNQDGSKNFQPLSHPVHVGYESGDFDEKAIIDVLSNGVIMDTHAEGIAWKLVQVSHGEKEVMAYFRSSSQEAGFDPEAAAHQLDRMLGLGMVPATVRREILDQDGVLQLLPSKAISERQRVTGKDDYQAHCPLEPQKDAMHVFDALIGNASRSPSSIIYGSSDLELLLIEHGDSFGTESIPPAFLERASLVVGERWRSALLALTDDTLIEELGEFLPEQRLAALALRRDELLGRLLSQR